MNQKNVRSPLIELDQVSRIYMQGGEELEVLKRISLTIGHGEFVAIVGQSGSGKTTLMNILGCLDRPSRGTYRVKGRDIAEMDADALSTLRREVFGFVFQRYNLLSGSNAVENVSMPAMYAGMDKDARHTRGAQLLTRLGLEERLTYYPSQLSGGQQQRVSIARALMNGGEIILADEPTGALDTKSGHDVLDLLRELHAAGHTIILITHDPGIAATAERIITLRDGVVISDVENTGKAAQPELESDDAVAVSDAPSRMPLAAAVGLALRSLRDNRFRTVLTLLGIIIGVASVVTMLALGNGAKEKVLATIEKMGSDLIMVRPMSGSSRSSTGSVRLVDGDIAALRLLPGVAGAVGETSGSISVRYQESDYQTTYTGTGVDKPVVGNWGLAKGEFFTSHDVSVSSPVVVLGQTVVNHLYPPDANPVGTYVMIRNVPFLVIGVMQVKGASAFGTDEDDVLLVPVTTARLRLMGQKYLRNAIVKAEPGADTQALQSSISAVLLERHGTEDFRVLNTASIMEAASESQNTLTVLLGSVAAISLLVGGIGVMNIMLVSVVERTREIGIRMACGARRYDIMVQFITEALMVCALGGVLGIVFGLLAAAIAQYYGAAVAYSVSPALLALSCSFATGLIFGFAPARKASLLDPVAALASE
ncbi:fused macrolide transporter subunits of ABC superfamily: ATP-binding component; membrane component [uncultured delta proteobacterium]|uniref:Fused macrolide transporter subunits of ABC superfamily: ATP-binding component membrane component n=1 Tax=uncultured delta proteobacterium TaxID=34034 RepID=A0A212IX94_9DELT|nr:fused macrolide transporter subunits of ABC superfamily: ATP-binding component; membrane component [uncultured delta proteobacterium]